MVPSLTQYPLWDGVAAIILVADKQTMLHAALPFENSAIIATIESPSVNNNNDPERNRRQQLPSKAYLEISDVRETMQK